MKTDKYSLSITAYEYNVLMKNSLISTIFAKQMGSAIKHGDEFELTMTLSEGFDLNQICDYLEAVEHTIKSDQEKRS